MLIELTELKRVEGTLRQTEDQLRHAQKMEAIGRLAGGVAHDFNNILSVILSYGELVQQGLPGPSAVLDDVVEIRRAAQRAAGLTRQLLMFSRQQVLETQIVDFNALLVGLDKMLRRILGEDVALTTIPARRLGMVRADPGSLEQVVMNLVVNARDAMPRGGRLTIETANVALDEAFAAAHVGVAPGAHVLLAVTDTGTGMDTETQARIFEPASSRRRTRARARELGLSTVFGIVRQSGGTVWVSSEPGQGTTFRVYLPRVDGKATTLAATVPPETLRARTETILLVEDDAQLRTVAASILRKAGYEVLPASSGEEAVEVLDAHPATLHLLLSDVVLPGMSGPDLARLLVARQPGMRVLCMSGYADDSVVRHGALRPGIAFLQKPITPAALTRKVREVLDAARA